MFCVKKDYVEITFNCGKKGKIDKSDYGYLKQFKWHLRNGYANRNYRVNRKQIHVSMHREIMNAPKGLFVDHINGDKLDNRRSNLRLCNNAQNQWNTYKPKGKSRYKGVIWQKKDDHKNGGFWVGRIWVYGRAIFLGRFENEVDAALAYNKAALKYHGEFARINPIEETGREIS